MLPNAADVPRCVQRLNHGDWVVLEAIQSSTAYAVRPAYEEAGVPALLYLSTLPPQEAVEEAACLEVVEQGEWLGLRSPLLEGLFLQARKKAPNLVFFSPRLGVWEQWKAEALYQGMLQQQSPAICLTSRQAPAITLSVRAWRVGSAQSPAPLRSLPCTPVQQLDMVNDHAAQQLPPGSALGLLGYAASVSSSLQDDALELSHHVVKGYVLRVLKWPLYLTFRLWRAEARTARNKRREAAVFAERRLQSAAWAAMQQWAAVERHARHMVMLACQCWTRHHTRRLVGALREWHARAERSVLLDRICTLCQRRERRRRSVKVLEAWGSYIDERRALRGRCELVRLQLSKRRARRVLQGWQEAAAAQRRHICAFQRLLQQSWVRRAIIRWHHLARHLASARHAANAIFAAGAAAALRAVMAAWRGLSTRRRQLVTRAVLLEDAAARRLLGSVWCAWRVLVDEGAVRRHRVELVILVRQQQLTGRVLRRWLVQVRVAAVLRAAAEQIKRRRERSLLPAAFAAWCAAARLTADGPHGNDGDARVTTTRLMGALQRVLGYSRRNGLARRVLSAWRHLTSASLQLQATATAVARMRRRTRTVVALACWRKVTRGCAALRWQLVAEHQRARLRRVLRAWGKAAADGRQLRIVRALAGRRLGFRRRFSLFHAWHGLVELRRELWHSAGRRHRRALATSVLTGWRRRCATVRAGIAALGRCRQGYERQLLQVALHVMRSRVVLRHRMQRWERQQVVILLRGILRAWRCWAARSARRSGFGRLLRKKWRRLVARGVLRAWFVASHSVALQTLLLEAMQAGWGTRCAARCRWHDGAGPQAIFPSVSVPARATALAAATLPHVERPQGAILRILMASHGGLSITGGRGGAAATAAVTEMLCMRLPTLVRLAMQPRRLAHAAFNTWRFVVACQVQLKAIVTRIKARCRSLLLYAYFKRWVSTVADGRARRAAAMAMARRLVRGWAATCLLAWGQEARLLGRLRRTCLKLLARRMGRMARAVILAWRTAVREQRERVQDKLRNRLDIRLALLHRAVQAWQQAVATAAELREAAEKRYTAAWMRFKRQVLLSWRRQTVFSLQNLITCSRLLQTRAERRLLAAVTAAWSNYTRVERQRREDWPMMCRVFYAWRTLVQSAGRTATAATAAAVAAELDVQRLRHICANAAAAPFTSIAATAVASPQARSIAPSSVARDEFDSGASASVDPGSLSLPGVVNPSSVRCYSDVEERNALAGVLAAQNIAWQPWYGMLQSGGGLAALPGGPILLPLLANMLTMAGADGGSGEASALRECLGRLDDPVRRVERGDGAREDGGAMQAQVQPAAITTAGSAPVSFPTAPQPPHPARAMTASCQPEPRPQSQKGPSSSTVASRATALFVAPSEESPTGGMTTAPLPPPTAATQGNSVTTAAGSAAPQPTTAAAAAAAIAANDLAQQVSLQPSKTPASRALSASVPPEPGPLFQIRQGSSTTIGRASNKSLGLREATDSIPRSVDSQVAEDGLGTAATQQGALEPAALQVTALSAPGAREQQTHKQQGHQPQQQEHLRQQQQQIQWQQQKEQGHPQRITAPSTPDILSSSEIGAESGPLFQVRDGSSVTVGCARTGLAGALQPFDFGFNDATTVASAAAKAPDEASHHVDQGARAQAIIAPPTLSILPPPPPPLQPPGLARSSDRLLTASCVPESARMSAQIQQNRGSSSSSLGRTSSGAISAVEPSGWAANMARPQTIAIEAGTSTRASAPTTAAPSVVPHTINIILQPYPHSHSRPTHSPSSRSASHGVSPRGNCNSGDTPHSVTSSEDTCSLASPGSLQAWSRRNTTELVGASEAASGISLPNATSGPSAAGGEGNSCATAQQDGYLALSLPITEGSVGQEIPGAHHSSAPSRRCGSPPDATGHHYRHHALQLSPIHSPSNQFDVLISSSSGEHSYVDVIQLQPQTSSELGPKSHYHGVLARCEKLPSTPSPRGCSAGGKLSDISVIDLIAADDRAEGHQRTGKLPPQNDACLGLSHVTWSASGQAPAAAAIPVAPTPRWFGNWTQSQVGCDDLAVVPGQLKPTAAAAIAAAEDSSFVGQDNPYPHLTLPSQSSNWSSVESGSGVPVPMPGLAPQGSLPDGLHPAPSMLVQHPRQPSAGQLHPGGAVANGAWTGPNVSTAVGLSAPVRRSFSHGTSSSWASSSVGPALAAPAPVLASSNEASEHLSGPVLHGAYELAHRRTTESSFTPSTATQQRPQAGPSQTGSVSCADGRMQGDGPAGRLESTLSVRTDAISNLTPLDTNISDLEALFGALEARSKSAMSSVHCTSLPLAIAGGGLAAESMIARRRLAKADTGGGATASTGGRDVGPGLRLLDGIDALLGRANTLSAPGAPIFAARDGSDAPASYEHSCTTAESSYGESIRNDPLLAPSGAGKRPSPEKGDAAKAPVRGDLLDAALRRLEAASVNARLAAGHATAAWPAAKEGGAPVRVGQDDKRHPANVKATEEQPRAGVSWQEGVADALHTEWYPSTAIALVAGGIDRAHAASRRSGGGSAGGLLATFISGAEEAFRHQAVANGQRSPPERQLHQSLSSRLIMKQEQQEQRQRRCEGRVVRPGVWDEDDRSNFSEEDSAARATSARLRPAALQGQAASSGRTPGRPAAQPQLQPQPQPLHGASAAGAVGPPDSTGFVHGAASPLATSEAEMEVVTVCPNRGSPVCTQQRPSPHWHGDISAGRDSSSQRRQRQERIHLERSPEGTAKQRLKWSGDDGTGTNGDHEGSAERATVDPRPHALPATSLSTQSHAMLRRQSSLPSHPHPQPQSPPRSPQLRRPGADPLEEVLLIAQRRGNLALAATLAGLVRNSPRCAAEVLSTTVADQLEPHEGRRSTPKGPSQPHCHQQVFSASLGESAASGRAAGVRTHSAGSQSWSHGGILCGSPSTADGASIKQGMMQQSSPHMHDRTQPYRTAVLSGREGREPDTGMGFDLTPSPHNRASGEAPNCPNLRSPPKPASHTPLLRHADCRSTTASGDGSSNSSSESTGASSGGDGNGDSSICKIVAEGFNPDPLHSPLRSVLGECLRLQSSAAQLEAEGDAIVRNMVAELSPRSAVEAALNAVLAKQQQSGPGAGGSRAGSGRRLVTPNGRRG